MISNSQIQVGSCQMVLYVHDSRTDIAFFSPVQNPDNLIFRTGQNIIVMLYGFSAINSNAVDFDRILLAGMMVIVIRTMTMLRCWGCRVCQWLKGSSLKLGLVSVSLGGH